MLTIFTVLAIGGAFATVSHSKDCTPVYYKDSSGHFQLLSGVTQWTCDVDITKTCDYDSNHSPCDPGVFRIITP